MSETQKKGLKIKPSCVNIIERIELEPVKYWIQVEVRANDVSNDSENFQAQ